MSRIGSIPIKAPQTVQIKIQEKILRIEGTEGKIDLRIPDVLKLEHRSDDIKLKRRDETKKTKSVHGLYRQLIHNAIKGVETPWEKKLEVVGTGFNVKLQGEDLVFKLGYSHPIMFKKRDQVKYKVEGSNVAVVLSPDKQIAGQVAQLIKKLKLPDAYKGKGIRYKGERIKLKPGKKVKAVTATTA